MFGAKVIGAANNETVTMEKGTASGAIAAGDFVNVDAGVVRVAAAGEPIKGVAVYAAADTATVYYHAAPHLRVIVDNDNDTTTFASTHVGSSFNITGTTGAQQIDTSTVLPVDNANYATQQLRCVEYNPEGYGFDSDTSIGAFELLLAQ